MISLRGAIVEETRRIIEQKTGLKGEQVILHATHCHSGPQMHPLFLRLTGPEGLRMGTEYINRLPGMIAESLRLAEADLQPAKIFMGSGHEEKLSFNRRYLMKDGTFVMNPGKLNPNSVRPMGPIDAEVGVLYAESLDGKPLVTLVNFALHVAIVGGRQFSADYPHTLARLLGQVKGPDMLTIFAGGTSGNVNHVDFSRAEPQGGESAAAYTGVILAAEVLKTYRNLKPIEPDLLRAQSRKVSLPAPVVTPEEVKEAQAIISRYNQPKGPAFFDVVRAWRTIDLAELKGRPLITEVQAITLGDQAALVGFPGDAFVELGLGIKTNSPFPFHLVAEQSGNGSISYVPNYKAFQEGGYEVISARFLPGGGELLVDAAVRLLAELYPHKLPN